MCPISTIGIRNTSKTSNNDNNNDNITARNTYVDIYNTYIPGCRKVQNAYHLKRYPLVALLFTFPEVANCCNSILLHDIVKREIQQCLLYIASCNHK